MKFVHCLVQFSLKVLISRPDLDSHTQGDGGPVPAQEASVKLSVLPIRLNIDQVYTCIHVLAHGHAQVTTQWYA